MSSVRDTGDPLPLVACDELNQVDGRHGSDGRNSSPFLVSCVWVGLEDPTQCGTSQGKPVTNYN